MWKIVIFLLQIVLHFCAIVPLPLHLPHKFLRKRYRKATGFASSGKERDSETGFSYFGARYYDSDLMTGWLSVDPMADKYPNISPYAYCAWNPVKLVDPDGREIW